MSPSEYDELRPPERPRRRRGGGPRGGQRGGPGAGPRGRGAQRWLSAGDGTREMPTVPDVELVSYYGRPIVKPAPWGHDVAAYLFLGGVAGGSGLIATGAQLTGRDLLRRNARLGAMAAVALGGVALVRDLGRPERFYNMLRTIKLTSPMSVGSWILTGFASPMGLAVAGEIDRMTGSRLPLGPLRPVLRFAEPYAGLAAGLFGAPLAAYTAVLLGDTATPTWHAMHRDLPFVFVSSASLAAAGLAMVTTPTRETGPARMLAVLGVTGDVTAMRLMERRLDDVVAEPLHHGAPGRMLRWSERLAVAGAVGTLVGGRHRPVAVASGLCLLAASALTRFGVFEAGIESAKDPRYTVEPQRRRLAARRARGILDDSITTAG